MKRTVRARLLPAVMAPLIVATGAACGSPAERAPAWTPGWSTAMYDPGSLLPAPLSRDAINGRTLRTIVRPTVSGPAIRLRFSNAFGRKPLVLRSVQVAVSGGGALLSGKPSAVTFGGRNFVIIAPGRALFSDALPVPANPVQKLAVSFFLPRSIDAPTLHLSGWQSSYVSKPGDHAAEAGDASFAAGVHAWTFLDRLEVAADPRVLPTVVAVIGDSITAGAGTARDEDRRWTDQLDRRLSAAGKNWAVLNAGINGNTASWPSLCLGLPAARRLRQDVLSQARLSAVIIMVGVNDLIQPSIKPVAGEPACTVPGTLDLGELKAAYRAMAAESMAAGTVVIPATIPPFRRSEFWSPAVERQRGEINRWLRAAKLGDGLIDLDLLAAPGDRSRLRSEFDSGDGLHPNEAGAAAIAAEAVRALDRTLLRHGA